MRMLLFILIFPALSFSQQSLEFDYLPNINHTISLNNNTKINTKIEGRFEDEFDIERLDLSAIATTKVGLNGSLSAGYLIRSRFSQIDHRLIQQYIIKGYINNFPITHRFSTDETFIEDASTQFRIRYRLNGQIPLNGQKADKNETYLKIGNEFLNVYLGDDSDLEYRLATTYGYIFNNNNRIEIGPELRTKSIFIDQRNSAILLSLNWYLSKMDNN